MREDACKPPRRGYALAMVTRRRLAPFGVFVALLGCSACAAVLGFEDGTLVSPEDGTEAGADARGDRDVDPDAPSTAESGAASEAGKDGSLDAQADADADADVIVEAGLDAADAGHKQAFETPLVFNGRLDAPGVAGAGGLAAGDARCNEAAQAAFPGRTFKAWLSTTSTSAASRLVGLGPWYVGDAYLASLAELKTANLHTPLHQDPSGAAVGAPLGVWTGTDIDGTYALSACSDWTSAASNVSGEIGTGGGGGTAWTYATARSCDVGYHLYCFEQ